MFIEQIKQGKHVSLKKQNVNRPWESENDTKPPPKTSCATTRSWEAKAGTRTGCNEHIWHDVRWSDLARQVGRYPKQAYVEPVWGI